MKKILVSTLFSFSFFISQAQQNVEASLQINNLSREYLVHLPAGYKSDQHLSVVFIFHGGGGNNKQMQRHMAMDTIADKENFITVYPQGINKQWNDGREFKESISGNDDVKFIDQLLDTLLNKYAADPQRIFATGISNGAFFSLYLSYKLSNRFLAIAPVCGTIPQRVYDEFYPASTVSLLLINGTKDPLVPYEGGTVGNRLIGNRGDCMSTDKTIQRYIQVNKTATTPVTTNFPDKDRTDGCEAIQYSYNNGMNNSKVVLIKIIDGGHTLPGGAQYLPKIIVGKVCRDFNANEVIWEFFKNCPSKK